MNDNFSTKDDLKATELSLRSDMKAMEMSIRSDMKEMESSLRSDIQRLEANGRELEYRLTIKLGSMMALAIGVTATLVKVL